MKLRFVLVRYLANLQFAIILLLTIASFSILGSIIEQDQPIDFYKNAYSQPWFGIFTSNIILQFGFCLLYTSPSPRDRTRSRMPSSA